MRIERGPQRAVFHWINVTGERRLRFNYRANLRFDRASACVFPLRRESDSDVARMAWGRRRGDAQRGTKWIGKMGSEIIVMKLARLPLSAFMGVVPKGRPGALSHRADCYWLIDVDSFSLFLFFFLHATFSPAHGALSARARDITFTLRPARRSAAKSGLHGRLPGDRAKPSVNESNPRSSYTYPRKR